MLRRLRENGPVVLVPLAWTFAAVASLGLVRTRTVLIAHLVMVAVLLAFTALSWSAMQGGVLRAWKLVLLVGLAVTLAGTVGLLQSPPVRPLLWVSLVGWLVVPAPGLLYTGRHVDRSPRVYTTGGALSLLGAAGFVLGTVIAGSAALPVVGIAIAGVGQTAGIAVAVRDY